MENTNQKPLGLWDKVTTEDFENYPKVSFEINIPVEVTFKVDSPREVSSENGDYCIFDVKVGNEDRVVMTSAWTLLKELKKLAPLKNKTIVITKKMDKGKQFFHAIQK